MLLPFAATYRHLPLLLLCWYAGASIVAAMLYVIDKRAAIAGKRRISENTLHLAALIGGWPGAFAAQRRLRHKTAKFAFRTIFWLTVLLNCAVLVAFATFLFYKDKIA